MNVESFLARKVYQGEEVSFSKKRDQAAFYLVAYRLVGVKMIHVQPNFEALEMIVGYFELPDVAHLIT